MVINRGSLDTLDQPMHASLFYLHDSIPILRVLGTPSAAFRAGKEKRTRELEAPSPTPRTKRRRMEQVGTPIRHAIQSTLVESSPAVAVRTSCMMLQHAIIYHAYSRW